MLITAPIEVTVQQNGSRQYACMCEGSSILRRAELAPAKAQHMTLKR